LLVYFIKGKSLITIKLIHLKPDKSIIRESFAIGSSAFARQIAGSVLGVIMNNLLIIYGGDISVAVFGVINRLFMVFLMPIFGINQGFMPILGFNYGANKISRALKAIKLSTFWATIISIGAFLLIYLFPSGLLGMFSNDELLLEQGVKTIRIVGLLLPFIGIQVIGAGMFQALGKAVPALLLSMSRQILFLIPLILILPNFFGLNGIWISFPIADFSAFSVTMIFFLREMKKFKTRAALQEKTT
jgi:Na+-driven multidrug efflux pump